jgi:non-heme chloroperoxidase
MKTHKITGGGSVQLHVVETGNQRGRPVVFLHGVSQSWLTWNLQMSSSLADAHRLVAMDAARSWSLGQTARRLHRLQAVGR